MNDDKNLNLKYKFNTKCDDLVCEITDFMDKYILFNNLEKNIKYSYIYNDLSTFSTKTRKRVIFRAFGASRGCIYIKRVTNFKYKILDIKFNETSFSAGIGCYDKNLKKDIKKYIGYILDFSNIYSV